MKKLLTILLGIALVLPLYSQETTAASVYDDEIENETGEEITQEETQAPADGEKTKEGSASKSEKKKFDFARQYFEMGFSVGLGFDNGIAGLSDVLKKNVVIDLTKIAQGVPEDGTGLNFGLYTDFFMNLKNIHIGQGVWDFGFIVDVDGGVNVNIPKSLFTLISEGNAGQPDSSGAITGSGGIYTEIGLKGSAKYPLFGKILRAGIKPAIYTPAVYISPNPGISYHLYTNQGGKEGLFLDTSGEISIYTPTNFEKIEPGRFIVGPSGFDISLEGEYPILPFLDVGGSFNHIPFAPATLTNEMKISMKDFSVALAGEDLMSGSGSGSGDDTSSPEFETTYSDNANKQVFRPFRFDVYARYRPLYHLGISSELLVLIPNIGFSVNGNKGDEKGYFNAGLEARLNLMNLFIFYLGSGYQEDIWRQRIGLNINLRAFEFDLETTFRDHTFEGCFIGRGFGFNLGFRFGW